MILRLVDGIGLGLLAVLSSELPPAYEELV
jgi:hypothetical protein